MNFYRLCIKWNKTYVIDMNCGYYWAFWQVCLPLNFVVSTGLGPASLSLYMPLALEHLPSYLLGGTSRKDIVPSKQTKNAPSDDDSLVTMSSLWAFYREMLHQQQDNFKSFVPLIADGTNKRLNGVIRDIQDVKASLEFTQNKAAGLMIEC